MGVRGCGFLLSFPLPQLSGNAEVTAFEKKTQWEPAKAKFLRKGNVPLSLMELQFPKSGVKSYALCLSLSCCHLAPKTGAVMDVHKRTGELNHSILAWRPKWGTPRNWKLPRRSWERNLGIWCIKLFMNSWTYAHTKFNQSHFKNWANRDTTQISNWLFGAAYTTQIWIALQKFGKLKWH